MEEWVDDAENCIRPLITWAPGTQGSADICDASYQYATGSEYEAQTVNNVILAGWAIA
jgi:hypothetical protein